MKKQQSYILWDFDGTLVYRRAGGWEATVLSILGSESKGVHVTLHEMEEALQPILFWNQPDVPHLHLTTANQWWQELEARIAEVIHSFAGSEDVARVVASKVRASYTDLDQWALFDDTLQILEFTRSHGFMNVILSNHTPELEYLIQSLRIDHLIDRVFNSAVIGYEKPNVKIFEHVFSQLPKKRVVTFIGNSIRADYRGSVNAGIPFILMHKRNLCVSLSALTYGEAIGHIKTLFKNL